MSKKLSLAQRIKRLQIGESFAVGTESERQAVCRMAKALRDIEAIDFNIITRANESGFLVVAIP